ncbi:hypothetical protein MUY27_18525 [Mucilaginibacter sp. RS28]|uniref:Uncharacterized protein n=1 Tax=Mucilaginibacter straminoryzae TaxID=2932774 RepID=A0A9X1X7R8_9SPHI|nr:hypothetical protein [Mucilaginibacter straminoryzae]MCJ8211720.1 hypothetical protein [Mucilaginibacter straminoryzae]
MEPTQIINLVYHHISSSITERLAKQGYLPAQEQHNDIVFDSRYIIWSNDQDALRLTWDGKEEVFLLEVTYTLPISGVTQWEELAEVPFNISGYNQDDEKLILETLLEPLN